MKLLEKIKALNPVCKAMREFRKETEEIRTIVAARGREAMSTVVRDLKVVK